MKFTQGDLSLQDYSWLGRAKKIASTSDCRQKHGCVAIRGGRVLAVGVNAYRNARQLFDIIPSYGRSIHAEEACLKALGGEARGVTMYIARVNNYGVEMMSKPCSNCAQLLKEAGVKKVVYTIESQMVFE